MKLKIVHFVTGSLIDRRVVLCPSHSEQNRWVETLRQEAKLAHNHVSSKPQSLQMIVSVYKSLPAFKKCTYFVQL